jgi:hypothetical protein
MGKKAVGVDGRIILRRFLEKVCFHVKLKLKMAIVWMLHHVVR